jgi:hypothetical protein
MVSKRIKEFPQKSQEDNERANGDIPKGQSEVLQILRFLEIEEAKWDDANGEGDKVEIVHILDPSRGITVTKVLFRQNRQRVRDSHCVDGQVAVEIHLSIPH